MTNQLEKQDAMDSSAAMIRQQALLEKIRAHTLDAPTR